MTNPSVYVIIPNWNGKDLLSKCLSSVLKQTQPARVVVVDNGSTDGSQKFLLTKFPDVELIVLDRNYGFAGGVNRGLEAAMKSGAKYAALLNNDAVADKDWLKNLVEGADKHPGAGIITSKMLRQDKKHLDSTGDFLSTWGLPFPRGRNELDKGQYDGRPEVFSASGGASLYRLEVLKKIGLFDEDFFAYFEDVDLSFRAQLAGWKVFYEPSALVYHEVNATSARLGNFSRYHSVKNFLLLYAKNMPRKLYFKYLPLFCLQYLRWFLSSLVRGHLWTFIKGTAAAIRLHPSTLQKRRDIQKSRKVSVEYTDNLLYHHRPPRPTKLENI